MDLYITEKPDVGRNLADYLARKHGRSAKREDGYMSIPGVANITWARGHLLELAEFDHYLRSMVGPEALMPDGRVRWAASLNLLPFFPENYEMVPSTKDADKRKQLNLIRGLIKDADVIYHSADRDREGQAIIDNILDHFGIKGKKVMRLAFSALDDASLDEAFKQVESNDQPKFKGMGLAARARAISDMSLGLNLTRLLSVLHSPDGVMTAGRVQTPLLGIIVERQWAIDGFKPKDFYTPIVTLPDGTELKWKKRAGDRTAGFDEEGRIIDMRVAQDIVDRINQGLQGVIDAAAAKELREAPPLPYSLPALQTEMGIRHGLSVDDTTAACQGLYEKKMQSYIGTDCRYLPESMHAAARDILAKMRGNGFKGQVEAANSQIKYKCWDDGKITAHHAIIPTGEHGSFSNKAEELVYKAVSSRYLAQFHPESVFIETRLEATFGQDSFSSVSKDMTSPGWRAIDSEGVREGKPEQDEMTGDFVPENHA